MSTSPEPTHVIPPNRDDVTIEMPVPSTAGTLDAAPRRTGTVASLPGYAVLEELGRGGMGVVYKARHLALNRVVAVKVILTGVYAGHAELLRFRTEVEAIARLHHPGIVQIHEVGEHQGHAYFSLEYCAGGSLETRLRTTPLPPQEAAALVQKLAQAMQAAHQARIIHRDLKPANILLVGSEGEAGRLIPKITDFGLAKKLDEAGQTQTGSVLGTPSYMAPEQAAGHKQVGPAVDLYSLGAILYECLTGRPPFRAATTFDTLREVLATEPVPPRQLNTGVPRDLETICLKCLQKEPGKRYGTAQDLADDLKRFVCGEPIQARPIGTAERVLRWCRRNPVAAGLISSVAAVLVLGFALSTAFALEAAHQAERAQQNAAAAQASSEHAARERADAVVARDTAQAVNQQLVSTAARSLLRPMATEMRDRVPELSDPEIDALWELSSTTDERLRLQFVVEALQRPLSIRQLEIRAEHVLHAAVGLNLSRREQVEQMLTEKMRSTESPEERVQLALTLAWFGSVNQTHAREVTRILLQAMKESSNEYTLNNLTWGFLKALPILPPPEAVNSLVEAATIVAEFQKTLKYSSIAMIILTRARIAGLERLDAATATTLANELVQAMDHATGPDVLACCVGILRDLAGQLPVHEGIRLSAQLDQLVRKTSDPPKLRYLAEALTEVTGYLEPATAAAFCHDALPVLLQPLSKQPNPAVLCLLARGIGALITRLEPAQRERLASETAERLTTAMRTQSKELHYQSTQALIPLLNSMNTREAAVLLTGLSWKNPDVSRVLTPSAVALAQWIEPGEAAVMVTHVCDHMRATQYLTSDAETLYPLVVALGGRVEPKVAVGLIGQLLPLMTHGRPGESQAVLFLGRFISSLAASIEPVAAEQFAHTMLQGLTKPGPSHHWLGRTVSIAALSSRLEARQAAVIGRQVCRLLVQAVNKANAPEELYFLAQSLPFMAKWLDPTEIVAAAKHASAVIIRDLDSRESNNTLYRLVIASGALAPCLETADVIALADAWLRFGHTARNETVLYYLARVIVPLSLRLNPEMSAHLRIKAAYLCMSPATNPRSNNIASDFVALLAREAPETRVLRATRLAGTVAALTDASNLFTASVLLHRSMPPEVLPPQSLVDLLGHPLCIAEYRRHVLDQLQRHYQRDFADQWEFIRFARENQTGLHLDRVPQRSR